MKRRDPGTFKSALTHIVSRLGAKRAADAVGRSQSLVRKWADPDETSLPNLEQAALLDRAYVEAELGEPPIHNVLENEAFAGAGERERDTVTAALLDLQGAIGELARLASDDLDIARRPEGGLSTTDRHAMLECVDVIERETRALKRVIKACEE